MYVPVPNKTMTNRGIGKKYVRILVVKIPMFLELPEKLRANADPTRRLATMGKEIILSLLI